MRFEGFVWKDKKTKYWLIEVPMLDVMTQGTSKRNAFRMLAEALELLANQPGFKIDVQPGKELSFTIGSNQDKVLIALMLRRQREAHHLTLMQVAKRLDSKSPNAYARYEQGKSVPTLEKLKQLLQAINPDFEPVLKAA